MACSDGPSLEMKELSQETFDGGTMGLRSFGNPCSGPTIHNQQNHLPSVPNCINPEPCTYSHINGTTQPGIKTDSETHKDDELATLKNDKVNYARNRCAQLQLYLLAPSDKLLHPNININFSLWMHFGCI